ncbi:MAG: hypothetical protein HC769_35690 [Cyanobacteria bacterium CRU_2_1]|nr:hypothetical protein [Cyanobacteria bacterium CRU_2_1]
MRRALSVGDRTSPPYPTAIASLKTKPTEKASLSAKSQYHWGPNGWRFTGRQ